MPADLPVRRIAVTRFPYYVIYLETKSQIRILAAVVTGANSTANPIEQLDFHSTTTPSSSSRRQDRLSQEDPPACFACSTLIVVIEIAACDGQT
jgi:hypothetical protein